MSFSTRGGTAAVFFLVAAAFDPPWGFIPRKTLWTLIQNNTLWYLSLTDMCHYMTSYSCNRWSVYGLCLQKTIWNYLGLPVQHRLAGEAYIFCCCTLCYFFFFLTPELIDENRRSRRLPILYQQWGPRLNSSTDVRPMLPPFFTGEQNVPNFGANFDPSLQTAVCLNWGALSENKNKLVKDRW